MSSPLVNNLDTNQRLHLWNLEKLFQSLPHSTQDNIVFTLFKHLTQKGKTMEFLNEVWNEANHCRLCRTSYGCKCKRTML